MEETGRKEPGKWTWPPAWLQTASDSLFTPNPHLVLLIGWTPPAMEGGSLVQTRLSPSYNWIKISVLINVTALKQSLSSQFYHESQGHWSQSQMGRRWGTPWATIQTHTWEWPHVFGSGGNMTTHKKEIRIQTQVLRTALVFRASRLLGWVLQTCKYIYTFKALCIWSALQIRFASFVHICTQFYPAYHILSAWGRKEISCSTWIASCNERQDRRRRTEYSKWSALAAGVHVACSTELVDTFL